MHKKKREKTNTEARETRKFFAIWFAFVELMKKQRSKTRARAKHCKQETALKTRIICIHRSTADRLNDLIHSLNNENMENDDGGGGGGGSNGDGDYTAAKNK